MLSVRGNIIDKTKIVLAIARTIFVFTGHQPIDRNHNIIMSTISEWQLLSY